jgi:hypothetical protein
MKLYFTCTLLSDVVLTSKSATEGFHPSLDYIPGSKFLGIAAHNLYDEENVEQTLDIFHNGKVKFGDAHININGAYSYPTPFSWYRDKLKTDNEIILFHDQSKMEDRFAKGVQLKQERGGYIDIKANKRAYLDSSFSIKSAYDRSKRKSEDEKMYGYDALKAGTKMLFTVETPEAYKDLIRNSLVGKKRVGRSRTAEYGLIDIQVCGAFEELQHNPSDNPQEVMLYAVSEWCFFDGYGYPTTDISATDLGIPSGKIDWYKSQIRYRRYQSYNSKRRWYNEDRIVIQKGSVVVVNSDVPIDLENLPQWVGSLHSEGFGKMVATPPFLLVSNKTLSPPDKAEQIRETEDLFSIVPQGDEDALITEMLEARHALRNRDQEVEQKVEEFLHQKNKSKLKNGTTKSQWGAIAGIAKSAPSSRELESLLFKDKEGFLCRGIAEEKWRGKVNILKGFVSSVSEDIQREVLIKTANKMQKILDEK